MVHVKVGARIFAPKFSDLAPGELGGDLPYYPYGHTVTGMASFNPFRPEVELAWVRLRGKQIAEQKGCSHGSGEAEAMCELQRLREGGAPMPWEGKVVSIAKSRKNK